MLTNATFRIEGISPILMNNPESMQVGTASSLATKKIPTPEEEAAAKVYRAENGQLYIPSIAFRSSMIGPGGGASGRRVGKYTANSRCSAGVFTVEAESLLINAKTDEPITDYEVHSCRAVVQRNGVRRSRPIVHDWATDLVLEVDDDFISLDQVHELLNISGKVAGVMDFRPQKKGVFGRYRVAKVTVW